MTPNVSRQMAQQEKPYQAFSSHFFAQDTCTVAKALLGAYLVQNNANNTCTAYRIVETEAYTGNDPACHAYGRKTGRAATLYGPPGLAYVYLIYGMYHCLNVVSEPGGTAGAVLFRAVAPILQNAALSQTTAVRKKEMLTNGPGKLTRALGITKALHNEMLLTHRDSPLFLAKGSTIPESQRVSTTRIGIQKGQELPWRFYIKNDPWVSAP